jgi:hypothetical protein
MLAEGAGRGPGLVTCAATIPRRQHGRWPVLAGRGDLIGCPWHDAKAKLRTAGLRATWQRMALAWILFAKGDRHVSAEML